MEPVLRAGGIHRPGAALHRKGQWSRCQQPEGRLDLSAFDGGARCLGVGVAKEEKKEERVNKACSSSSEQFSRANRQEEKKGVQAQSRRWSLSRLSESSV